MSDDTFNLLLAVAAVSLFLLAGLGLAVLCFDAEGYWRWRR